MTSIRRAGVGESARRVIRAVRRWQAAQAGILVIAVDGHGAGGKSTIAAGVAHATGAALVHTDDFFQWPASRAAGPPPDGREWLPVLAAALGARPPRRMPEWAARLVMSPGLDMLMQARGAANAKARKELGWTPRYPTWHEGFRTIEA